MMRPALIACVGLSACARPTMLVADVRIDGYDLVIERCPVEDAVTSCSIERAPLPLVRATPGSNLAPDVGHDANHRQLARASEALLPCVAQHQLKGVLHVTFALDAAGHVSRVTAEDAPDLTECARPALASSVFVGTEVSFAWHVPTTEVLP